MITLQLLVLTLISMFLIPIIGSALSKENDEEILRIEQNNTKDPRYFAESFKRKFLASLDEFKKTGIFVMSREEILLIEENYNQPNDLKCDKIIYAKEDIKFGDRVSLIKEVYSKGSIEMGDRVECRGVLAEEDVKLGNHASIIRWVDGNRKVVVGDNSVLGISVSSGQELIVGRRSTFRRLYAPCIRFSPGKMMDTSENLVEAKIFHDILRDVAVIKHEDDSDGRTLEKSIITKYDLRVTNGMIVKGAISTHGTLVVEANSVIHGNIFAEKNIYIGQGVRVYGTIFTQEDIDIANGVIVGIQGEIKSVVARGKINIDNDTVVHGYISCEKSGKTR